MGRFSDQLRQAIDRSKMSRYAICKTIGLDQATFSKFMNGRRGLSIEVIEKLVDLLKLDLRERK